MEHFLLSYIDLTDTAILSGLQKNIYPLYDELKSLRGLKIEQHLPIVKRQDIDHK
jgi:Protein involved in initiation of plasmid replication